MRDGKPTTTMAFLRSQRKAADPDAACRAEMESDLREWWMHADEDRTNKHTNIGDTNQSMHNAIKEAKRFIVEEELESWLVHQNAERASTQCPQPPFRKLAPWRNELAWRRHGRTVVSDNGYNAGVVVVDTYCGDFALEHLDGEGFTWQGQRADARKT